MKTVYLDGKRVVVTGFASPGEVVSVREAIKERWPCCRKCIKYKPDITALTIVPPTLLVAQEIMETMSHLFIPVTITT